MTHVAQAALWMTGAIASFSSMAVAGRMVTLELDTFELMLYRSVIGFAIVLAVAGLAGRLGEVSGKRLSLHLVRNVSHFTGQNLWFWALTMIPMAQVFALEFTSPLWVAVLAPLILGERLTRMRALAAGLGFIGILIVARPNPMALEPGALAALGAAIGFAGSAMFTKRLIATQSVVSVLFWLTVMQTGLALLCAGLDGDIAWPSPTAWPPLAVIGFAGLMAHFCLTNALRVAPAILVMPMDFLRLPVIAVVGMALYAEPLEWAVFAGAALILTANFVNLRAEVRPR
ncbi:DMT family transporter [Rhodovulum adriaticum]|uniref:EamA domain-containing membrane protein RarD n=1 Tax=Rhodovulum adriaticum TaxID=35804 RepID=A0A4R2NVV5_RHOAD|nr:DMT family transporter [Rhodovulum adriaticum]MBK1636603.1 EamA family transporter [Rhodovulum adriaticum]TCP26092.1 EamA domain-containing membrane protein RarD [Rhodovulum adriaticum]